MFLERNNRLYGDNRVFSPEGPEYRNLPVEERARRLGWSVGCPLTEALIKPPSEGGKGAQEMERGYAMVGFWGGWAIDVLQDSKETGLVRALQGLMPRLSGEPLGIHCLGSIPEELQDNMIGAGNPYHYVFSRLVVLYLEEEKLDIRVADRLVNIKTDIQEAAALADHLADFIALVAARLVLRMPRGSESHLKILQRVLSSGKLAEDNCRTAYRVLARYLNFRSSVLGDLYTSLTPELFTEYHIADPASYEDRTIL